MLHNPQAPTPQSVPSTDVVEEYILIGGRGGRNQSLSSGTSGQRDACVATLQ